MKTGIKAVALALWLGAGAQAQAQDLGVYFEAGRADHHGARTDALTVGVRAPTGVQFFQGRLRMALDAYASRWDADALPGERSQFTQLGLVPMWRWRFDEGRSPWFVEAGIGVSYLVHGYRTRTKSFGSRWNFSDHLGAGVNFGPRRAHELGVYVKHVSNGGLDKPNPGETFYQLRYGYAF